VQTEPFRTGNFDTKFIEQYFKPEYLVSEDEETAEVAALLAAVVWSGQQAPRAATVTHESSSGWKLRRK
jgi:hypothetical protein